jgi:predicted DNA-binding transcriptional regulator AlpA
MDQLFESQKNNFEERISAHMSKLESMLAELIKRKPMSNSRVGGIELAREVTGYSLRTIYKKIKLNAMPHSKPNGKLFFSEVELRQWMTGDRKAPVILQQNKINKRRKSLMETSDY